MKIAALVKSLLFYGDSLYTRSDVINKIEKQLIKLGAKKRKLRKDDPRGYKTYCPFRDGDYNEDPSLVMKDCIISITSVSPGFFAKRDEFSGGVGILLICTEDKTDVLEKQIIKNIVDPVFEHYQWNHNRNPKDISRYDSSVLYSKSNEEIEVNNIEWPEIIKYYFHAESLLLDLRQKKVAEKINFLKTELAV
ncbi:MAG: hypothetical protein US50_C0002G0029 [Candidatus Nomurabacteria bacterium GW2011_GWB1_37_5]|uniref:Uncharacterized protein n=1 Tax=Candidatus Nomurabacteria bacterium GW2011_GWB1_37_5 TaxID=1618742 RepID=A0A0G0JGT8_9BACT|nr:MAG: hypothetical protein US50_C0002G0029 [Candidatus Nomurabacteria bacterium GW2011_GWB1_37_5]